MRRLIAIGALVLAVLVVLVIGTGAGSDDDGTYEVRAIFDSAGFLVPGEDVKISGVVVGEISALDVTPEKKAAVVLKITDPAFRDFKTDARCAVRLQSLLGEKYVACETTQPRNEGQPVAPPLRKIEDGPGEGQYLLPVERNQSAVDLDMLNNIWRVPERQRLAIIVSELGTGVAGNGDELRAVIRRANPALDNLDKFLKILGDQNRVIAKLATDSDAALAPVARESAQISNFIDKAGVTAEATAEKGDALERNFELFPQLLRELQPTMERLDEFTTAATPVFANLRAAAPSVNQIVEQLGPFSEAALPTFRTLGDAAEISRRALISAQPVIQDLRSLGNATGPLANNLARGLRSLDEQKGIDRFMRTVLGFSGALNGYDSVSHYARVAALFSSDCLAYRTVAGDCDNNFNRADRVQVSAASESDTQADEADQGPATTNALRMPQLGLRDVSGADSDATGASGADDPRTGVLGYLLGSEATR